MGRSFDFDGGGVPPIAPQPLERADLRLRAIAIAPGSAPACGRPVPRAARSARKLSGR